MEDYDDLEVHLRDIDHWLAIWRNLRSQLMPPPGKFQPTPEERGQLLGWIESRVFELDPSRPDPGRVTIRRLNRVEYRYAIQDLLGVDYDTSANFPADDTGYGFDTIGDVLSISPLHLEKYLQAARTVVEKALPAKVEPRIPERVIPGRRFRRSKQSARAGHRLSLSGTAATSVTVGIPAPGEYEVALRYRLVPGDRSSPSGTVELWAGERKIAAQKSGAAKNDSETLKGKVPLNDANCDFEARVTGETPDEKATVVLEQLSLKGPLDGSYREFPKGYRMIMGDGPAPEAMNERKAHAQKIMRNFVSRAFRRPLDRGTLNRLVDMVMTVDQLPNRSFEDGIRHALTAVLASPRFLFRAEMQPEPNNEGRIVPLDEYALASRLSFFLWSSVPDDELLSLAFRNELRENLDDQVKRMLADPRSRRFVNNFVGQWLQVRDVAHVPVDPRRILDGGDDILATREFEDSLRRDMRLESELFFEFVLKNGRPIRELLSARYSFLNEDLAAFYGINGVRGPGHRLVDLHEHPHRGGILGQGSFLLVTSNPTRTSPVKRGLFVLENILGTPAPPAPPDVPELEDTAEHGDRKLTMRQMMEIHREKPLCASCHRRMDPIGLGLENFNALGQFRTSEDGQDIDSSGVLVTGEEFSNVVALKTVLAEKRSADFYRCLTEKMLTYALGRGLEYYDTVTVNGIVEALEQGEGTLEDLVREIIGSVPFQKRRGD